jgi:hypothetical protein
LKALRFVYLSVIVVALCGCQTFVKYKFLPHDGVRPAEYAILVDRDISMIASDGIGLVASVYRPKMNSSTLTILDAFPSARLGRTIWPLTVATFGDMRPIADMDDHYIAS